MKKSNSFIGLTLILAICILYILWNKFILPEKNAYIGVSMDCKFCNENKGSHSHNLDKSSFNTKYENKALSGHRCPVCEQNPGSLHVHL